MCEIGKKVCGTVCIPDVRFYDGIDDCPNGVDEKVCERMDFLCVVAKALIEFCFGQGFRKECPLQVAASR